LSVALDLRFRGGDGYAFSSMDHAREADGAISYSDSLSVDVTI